MNRPRLLIGRAKSNDIIIPSDYVSRYHAMLLRYQGMTILVDLQSTNGTFVNSEIVAEHVLVNHDVIAIDRHSMFKQFSLNYIDPEATSDIRLETLPEIDDVIEQGMREVGKLLGIRSTDLSPTLRVNRPLKTSFIDDR